MNVEQHCSAGIGYICTVNTSILSTCQTLNKKNINSIHQEKIQVYFNKLKKKKILHSQSFQLGTGNSDISSTTKEADPIQWNKCMREVIRVQQYLLDSYIAKVANTPF